MSIIVCLIIIIGCLTLHAFFCASEMALVSANRLRIRHLADSGNSRARGIHKLLENPEKFLSTTMVGINLFLVLGATVASYLFSRRLGFGEQGPFIATIIMLPVVLIFAEIIPKNVVRPRATQISLILCTPLRIAYYILYPLIKSLNLSLKNDLLLTQ